jgi:hypothetical protein
MSRSLALYPLTCLLLAGFGCSSDYESCPMPRAARACACDSGSDGTQRCLPEMVWGACDCSVGAPANDGGPSNPAGSAAAGQPGSSGGGAPAAAGAGAGGSAAGAGASAAGAGAGAGAGGSAGMGGSAGAAAGSGGVGSGAGASSDKPAYGACTPATVDADCTSGSTCIVTPFLPEDVSVCAPACTSAAQCPTLSGDFDAAVDCVEGRCRYDCSSETPLSPLSCPSGMVCVADITGLTPAFCHDADGE